MQDPVTDEGPGYGRQTWLFLNEYEHQYASTKKKIKMEKAMKHKIFLFALLALTSCMKLKKKEDEVVKPQATEQAQVQVEAEKIFVNDRTELSFDYELTEFSDLHTVHFYAPEGWPKDVVVRIDEAGKITDRGETLNAHQEWSDKLLSSNKVTYQFFTKQGAQLILLGEAEILPVLDLDLTEDRNLAKEFNFSEKTKLIRIRSLKIASQKHLYLENFSGKIVIDNLSTENGFIQTFPSNSQANVDQVGRSGGEINLQINSGSGKLIVFMKGENGGSGIPAKLPDDALKGAKGERTVPADFLMTGLEARAPNEVFYNPSILLSCIKEPGLISNGHQGLRGYDGSEGRSGGNTGSIELKNFATNVQLAITSEVGRGGKLSIGGAGGLGGEPGDPADGADKDVQIWFGNHGYQKNPAMGIYAIPYIITKACSRSGFGTWGPQGERGNAGSQDGPNGVLQTSCLYFEDQKVKCINE